MFGSPFAEGESGRVLLYRHELGNRLLTFLCSVATNLTDMETCYKAVRTDSEIDTGAEFNASIADTIDPTAESTCSRSVASGI